MSSAISLLNEYCQQKQLPTPEYNTVETNGPSHNPMFTMKVFVEEREFVAEGSNKKTARSKCAAKAIEELDVDKYFKNRLKQYRYKICEMRAQDIPQQDNPEQQDIDTVEALWKGETEEIVLTIKRSNDHLEEYAFKNIKLKVLN
jgi:hypothetical protein